MFGYLRLFALISLLAVIGIAVAAGAYVHRYAVADLTRLLDTNNTGLARSYVDSTWRQYRDIIVPLAENNPAGLRNNPQVVQFAQETLRYYQHMPIQRANLYSSKGMLLLTATVDAGLKLANNEASPDAGFVAGQMLQVSAVSRLLADVPLLSGDRTSLVQTVVPIYHEGHTNPDGAVEILYDVRNASERLTRFQWMGTGGVVGLFLIFLSVLFLSARKAEGIIAKQYEANTELAAAAAAAQAETREKSKFLANISHELRTPLNAIIGFSEVIKDEVIAPLQEKKYHDYINDIHTSGVHLLSLINDILDYSKAEAGKLELEVSEVNVTKMIQNCMRLVGTQAAAAGVTLAESLPKDQISLHTDGKKFKQIILNLLSNAIKFTPSGGTIRLSAWENISEGGYSFEVRDTGIGIAPKDIAKAMAAFGQVDSALSRKYEGTGLGLPLTKKFVELMGGKFLLESEVNVGTTITFSLPKVIAPSEDIVIKQLA